MKKCKILPFKNLKALIFYIEVLLDLFCIKFSCVKPVLKKKIEIRIQIYHKHYFIKIFELTKLCCYEKNGYVMHLFLKIIGIVQC